MILHRLFHELNYYYLFMIYITLLHHSLSKHVTHPLFFYEEPLALKFHCLAHYFQHFAQFILNYNSNLKTLTKSKENIVFCFHSD